MGKTFTHALSYWIVYKTFLYLSYIELYNVGDSFGITGPMHRNDFCFFSEHSYRNVDQDKAAFEWDGHPKD